MIPTRSILALLAALVTAPSALAQEAPGIDPAVVPTDSHLAQIAEAGRLAGEIEACEFDWQPYYIAYMQSERRRAANEGYEPEGEEYGQRIAFIGMFFGANQGQVLAQSDGKPCSESQAEDLAERAVNVVHAAQDRED